MVCLRDISINTLHKGDNDDDDNDNSNNNNKSKSYVMRPSWALHTKAEITDVNVHNTQHRKLL